MILAKLWKSNQYSNQKTTIVKGSLAEWQTWTLGANKKWNSGRFRQNALLPGVYELGKLYDVTITIANLKSGRKIIGYQVEIINNRIKVKPVIPNKPKIFLQKWSKN